MKYIRTKDGRIAEVKDNMIVRQCNDATRLVYKDRPFVCVLRGNDDIEKEADTIEELCDGFETIRDGKPYGIRYKNDWYAKKDESLIIWEDSIQEYLMYRRDGEDIVLKGFIRTEKALIFVAKANDKGELELL